ncbi:ATP-binding cassette domain-containing protein [Gorillibacterium sp. sgz500922]|uniref:ABC transporter ATP-binding protein n=1 Tax=Gorillibacterium sp. sgz500922 TaxID=3446694 RepID=UPI003F676E2A
MTAIATVQSLTKRYGAVTAVDGISFTLEKGRSTALLGPNGAGKSTTLSMLGGLLKPTSGDVRMSSRDTDDRRRKIGYLPQHPVFFNWMTGREYMRFAGELFGMKGKQLESRANELLARLGLEDAAKRRIGGYSGGMKQRLGLAQAMIHEPELLILDEPVSALDPLGRRELLDLLQELRRETSLLFSTHVLPDAEELCQDILIMNKGKIALAGDIEDLRLWHRKPLVTIVSEEPLAGFASAMEGASFLRSMALSENGRELRLELREGTDARSLLLAELVGRSIPVVRFEAAYSTLEALFMEVVGA